MKKILFTLFTLCLTLLDRPIYGQEQMHSNNHMLRIYEDNDFINIRGKGTDEAYTNGTSIDFFYTKKRSSKFILDKVLPKAGVSSINIYGYGITQLMFTPRDISTETFQPNDYPYSGALFANHSLTSFNPLKKYLLKTVLYAGVQGPASGAKETQIFIHRLIKYQRPMGWDYQSKNKLLVNLNFSAEKLLAAYNNKVEIIYGTEIFTGTSYNTASVYSAIRIGKITPYFEGYFSQSTIPGKAKKLDAYFVLKPALSYVFSNSLLQEKPHLTSLKENDTTPAVSNTQNKSYNSLQHLVCSFNFSAVISTGKFDISFTQNSSTAMLKGLYNHEVGNISIYFSW